MTSNSDFLTQMLKRLRSFRQNAGLTTAEVEGRLIVGPGWVGGVEKGEIVPSLDMIASMLSVYNKTLEQLAEGAKDSVPHIARSIESEASGNGLDINFQYSRFNATYHLENATQGEFDNVIKTLRDGLAQLSSLNIDKEKEKAIKTESVAKSFLTAVKLWPKANPSDIWWFIIYRAYCDQYNHPSEHSRLDFTQSWKRTGGWALERVLEMHYGNALAKHNINLVIADGQRKESLLANIKIDGHRLEADKMDVLLTVGSGDAERLIGVIHVKASFAERRTDDVPMSQALVKAGYISPLWTMDCKSTPGENPKNRGELGRIFDSSGSTQRSAKRKDIEDDAYFSACFSYNKNTKPTPKNYPGKARIIVCDFSNPDDAFTAFIVKERKRIRKELQI